MKKALTLSIVIPVYNEHDHLAECLAAIAAQTVAPDEVIVVDNNSTDDSAAIAKRFPFVRIIREPRQSVLYARTKGYNAARSDIVGRIDADTELPPSWVAAVKQFFSEPSYVAVTGPVSYYDGPLPPINYWLDHQIRKHLYRGAPHTPFLFGSNMAIRRTAWKAVRPQLCNDKTIHEDLDLAIHLAAAGQTIHYTKHLMARVSARRYNDTFGNFLQYMAMYRHTYRYHQIVSRAPAVATAFYTAGYLLFKPYVRLYDRQLRRLSLRMLRHPPERRKNPMA